MSTVILDIETAPLPLSEAQALYLTKDCHNECEEAIGKAALSPFTGQVVCVGILNPETQGFKVVSHGGLLRTFGQDTDWHYHEFTEAYVLRLFWDSMSQFDTIVTFNGRGFDLPFLLHRSAILGVQPSRHDLMGYRYDSKPHCDLLDQMTYYGATKRFPLALACEAYGISNPKEGCDGSKVAELFAAGKHREIADYNLADLQATAALYKIWRERLCKK